MTIAFDMTTNIPRKDVNKDHNPIRSFLVIVSAGLTMVVLVTVIYQFLPAGPDWLDNFRPAALALLNGQNPYDVSGFYNPPWIAAFLIPFALLPDRVGMVLLFSCGLISFGLVAFRLRLPLWATFAFVTSAPVFWNLTYPNVDWLPLLGLVMPQYIGLIFLASKPQVGLLVGFLWLLQSWRTTRWSGALKLVTPVTILFCLSFIAYGLWPLQALNLSRPLIWNVTFFPYSVPFGLALFYYAWREQESLYAITAALLLSPYVGVTSWVGPLLAFYRKPLLLVGISITLWWWLLFARG